MVYEVIYTPQFENDFVELMNYLANNWSNNVAQQFGNQLDDLILTLSKCPSSERNRSKIRLLGVSQLPIKTYFITRF